MTASTRDCRNTARLVVMAACILVVGCSPSESGSRKESTGVAHDFKVALLTPGPISDQSWNGGAYRGLMDIRDSLGAQVSHIQTKTPAEFEENFRQYGEQGYTVVFGHGFEFQDAARRVAPDFPKTLFITTSGTTTGANLAGIRFAFEEPSYAAGILAARMTKSKRLGAIGGTELPPVRASFEAFTAGARSVDPSIQVAVSYVGNWDDVAAGKEQALAQISRGIDVIFQNADAAGLGVFQAVRESKRVWVIGSNADQNSIAPQVTLASVLIDLPLAFLTLAKDIKSGTFQPRVVALEISSGVVRLVLNPTTRDQIPPSALAMVDSVTQAIASGALIIPVAARDSAVR